MTNDIPQIDDLTKGLNDSGFFLDKSKTRVEEESNHTTVPPESDVVKSETDNIDQCWKDFIGYLSSTDIVIDKSERLVCKLDRDLAESLDDCDIYNHCRSDLVNAIVRSFFENHLSLLAQFRREKKTLFENFKNE